MNILTAILTGAALIATASGAIAIPLDPNLVRPVTVNQPSGGEASLQTELNNIFGAGMADASKDQQAIGMFGIATPGSSIITPQFKFEWTSNASTQAVGIFGWDSVNNHSIDAQIFGGVQNPGDFANVIWNSGDSGVILTFDTPSNTLTTSSFSGIDRSFFGFYFQSSPSAPRYYSVDSLNPSHEARVLGFMPSSSGAAFSYEDGTDFDYNDAGFYLESITPPVPEPGTMMLLGIGFLALAIYSKRRQNL